MTKLEQLKAKLDTANGIAWDSDVRATNANATKAAYANARSAKCAYEEELEKQND